jgi:hypothetical protein
VIDYTLDLTEAIRLGQLVPQMRPILREEIIIAFDEAGPLLTTMVSARTPVGFGTLRSSIGFHRSGDPEQILEGLIQAAETYLAGTSTHLYSNYVEFGRRAGRWPPQGPIELWAVRKLGIPWGPESKSVAFLIARAIGTGTSRGTANTGAHMFQRAWDEGGHTKLQRRMDQVAVRAVKRFAALR